MNKKTPYGYVAILILFTSLLMSISCKKENSNKDELTQQVTTESQRILKSFPIKYEETLEIDPDTNDKNEFGEDSLVMASIINELKSELARPVDFSNDARVGVLMDGDCGNYDEIYIHLDCENNNGFTVSEPWTGSSSHIFPEDFYFHFCVVPGNVFTTGPFPYAVLQIDPEVPKDANGDVWATHIISMYEDNQDVSNTNKVKWNGSSIYNSWFGVPGGFNKINDNAKLRFLLYPGNNVWGSFPYLTIPYGVFGINPYKPTSNGHIKIDDEDKNNRNAMEIMQLPAGTPTSITGVPGVLHQFSGGNNPNGNTFYYTTKAH